MQSKWTVMGLALALVIGSAACNRNRNNPDVESRIEQSLDAAGLRDVNADQDREKGVVTLKGEVATEADKERADQIAKSESQGQIVANEIAVRPPGAEDRVADTQSALDDGIEENFKAQIVQNKLDGIDYDSNEGVLTLKGKVKTPAERQTAERLAASVPNVKQVVNEIEVNGQPATATSTNR
jgi:hyperosmotically inducible periplasmic protein